MAKEKTLFENILIEDAKKDEISSTELMNRLESAMLDSKTHALILKKRKMNSEQAIRREMLGETISFENINVLQAKADKADADFDSHIKMHKKYFNEELNIG